MGKSLEVSDMPPLSREMHEDLRQLETRLTRDLRSCCSNYDLTDPHTAFEYTRTAAIEFFDCFYAFYSKVPDAAYREHWKPASEKFALGRIVKCIENITLVESYFKRNQDRVGRIKRTISDHAKGIESVEANNSALFGKQASVSALAGIDIASASPLLMRAFDAAKTIRPTVFSPVQAPPRKRISRSIHSEKAARRMETHIQAKGISQTAFAGIVGVDERTLRRFRTSGKVDKAVAQRIAEAMSMAFDDLIS